ncbi:MAG TPA: sialidase family protein [Noviherbaspirillum sp.]|jgi:hypothetical protein|uniref:sialidase family protein n=1 Tax=Noviherbaspirillum sp. TaxID=1926288 RepID=UPI002F927106
MPTPTASILACALLLGGAAGAGFAQQTGGVSWQPPVDIAVGRGEKGPWEQNDSRYDYVDDPAVLLDPRGDALLAWVDQGSKDVYFQRIAEDGSRRFDTAVNVSRNPDSFSWLPRIAQDAEAPAQVYLLWQEIIFSGGSHGGDILFARSDDGGARFSAPLNLSRSVGGDGKGRIDSKTWHNGSFDLLAAPDNVLYAAWTEYEGPLWISRSTDGGRSFDAPRLVAGGRGAKPARAPALGLGKDGTLYLAWTTGEDDDADIHLAASTDGGRRFGEPRLIGQGKGYADAPRLATAPDGSIHLVFAQSNGGPFAEARIFHARSPDGSRFGTPRPISAALPSGSRSAAYPSLEIDGQGRLVVIHEMFDDPRKRSRGLALSVSLDGGERFSEALPVPASRDPGGGVNGGQQGLLMDKLAVTRDGGIAIVNSSLATEERSRVWLMRGTLQREGRAGCQGRAEGCK